MIHNEDSDRKKVTKNATWKKCNVKKCHMKKLQLGDNTKKKPHDKKRTMKWVTTLKSVEGTVETVKNATWKKMCNIKICNMKVVQQEKGSTGGEKLKNEQSATWKNHNMKKICNMERT